MQDLITQLYKRFPILKQLEIECCGCRESLPAMMGLLLAALDSAGPKACCLVLPRKQEIGRLSAVIYVLMKLKREFASICASQSLPCKIHDKVRIHPSNRVFRFNGVYEQDERFFWLECSNGHRTFPRAQASRIEKAR